VDSPSTSQARLWIVGGYLVVFVASVVEFIGQFTSFNYEGLTTTIAVAAGSLWTWWWLSQLKVSDGAQRRVIRNGIGGLIVVLIGEGTMSFTTFTSLVTVKSVLDWVLVTYLLMTVGEVAAAIGFAAFLFAMRTVPISPSTPPALEDGDA